MMCFPLFSEKKRKEEEEEEEKQEECFLFDLLWVVLTFTLSNASWGIRKKAVPPGGGVLDIHPLFSSWLGRGAQKCYPSGGVHFNWIRKK